MARRLPGHARHRRPALATASLTLLLGLSSAGIVVAIPAHDTFAPPPPRAATKVGGAITTDTTWTPAGSPYQVTGQVGVHATATLTIEPGVDVRFEQNGQLIVTGTLIAEGTADRRIRFLGVNEQPGGWRGGLSLQGTAAAPATARFAFVTISGGGVAGDFHGQLYLSSAIVEMRDSEVSGSAGDGIVVDSGSIKLTDTRLTGNAALPLHVRSLTGLGAIADVDPVLNRLTVEGNGVDALAIDGGILGLDSTWENAGAPYQVRGQILVHAPATLTIEPGVEVRFDVGGELYVEGSLVALGTAEQPIRLVGTRDAAGAWRGIGLLGPGSEQARASLAHVTVANAGNVGRAAIDVNNARLTFLDGRVTNHAAAGIIFSGGTVSGLIEGTVLADIGGVGVANATRNLVVATNNWWGSPTGPTTTDGCSGGSGLRVDGFVRYDPWLRAEDEQPGPLTPSDRPLVKLSPQRWFAPADGLTRVWVDVTLLDPLGNPIPGVTVKLVSSLGEVTSGGITDAAGHTLAYLTSTKVGDAEVIGTLSTADPCEQATSTTAVITFNEDTDGLVAGMRAPYFFDGIHITPQPVTRGVPTTISARLSNPNADPITVEASFEFVNLGIGLAFGPVGAPQTKDIPAGGEQVFETTFTPLVSGHLCVQVRYEVLGAAGASTIGPIAAANGPGLPQSILVLQGRGSGRAQANWYGLPGGLGPGGGKPGGKPPLEKAKNASAAVGAMGKLAGGATAIPRAGIGLITNRLFDHAGTISEQMGGDPPRQDYKLIAEPVRTPLPTMPRAADVPDDLHAAQVALAEALAEFVAIGDAALISLDRYGGASAAGDLDWASVQASSLLHYRTLLGEASVIAADKMAALRPLIERESGATAVLTRDDVIDAQTRIKTGGFSQEQIDAAHALGLSDDAIEADRQELVNANPDDLAGSVATKLADAETAFREMGEYLITSVNFSAEVDPAGSDVTALVAGVAAAEEDSKLARIYDNTATIQVGNPLDHTATVDLRVRRLSMPMEWPVELSPSSIVLGPGEEATVTITISATTPWPQGTLSEVAIEGIAEGKLLGGVVVALLVPRSVPFGVVPDAGPTPLMIALVGVGVALLLVALIGFVVLRRRRRAAGRSSPESASGASSSHG